MVWIPDLKKHKNFKLFERLSVTPERVLRHVSKHLEVGLKKLCYASFFQPTFQCLDILMKYSFSCLIHYVNLPLPIFRVSSINSEDGEVCFTLKLRGSSYCCLKPYKRLPSLNRCKNLCLQTAHTRPER